MDNQRKNEYKELQKLQTHDKKATQQALNWLLNYLKSD